MKKIIFTLCIVLQLSCTKKEETKVEKTNVINTEQTIADNVENDKQSLSDLLSKFEDESQFFDISNLKTSKITGKKGTIIHLVPNNLELENGSAITSNLKVELKELTNQKDLLRNNAQTMSNDKLLISGGSYYIDITSNGNKVNLKKGKNLEVEFPKITNRNMELFYGKRDSLNQMNWETANKKFISKKSKFIEAAPISEDLLGDSENSIDYNNIIIDTRSGNEKTTSKNIIDSRKKIYESINLKKLGWINCDAFYKLEVKNFNILYQNKNELSFVKTFIIFNNMNSLMTFYSDRKDNLRTKTNLPLNQKVKIISFSFKDDKFYAAEKEFTVSKDNPIQLSLKEVSEKDIEKLFKI